MYSLSVLVYSMLADCDSQTALPAAMWCNSLLRCIDYCLYSVVNHCAHETSAERFSWQAYFLKCGVEIPKYDDCMLSNPITAS